MRDLTLSRLACVLLSMLAAISVLCGTASAAMLVLNDGTVIHGDIKTLQDDVYTVETVSLGTLRVRKQTIRTIDHDAGQTNGSPANGSPTTGSSANAAALQATQLRILQDPGLLSTIQSLQNDPDVQAVLADPEIVSALASGNFAALMNHPKIIALTSNSKIREVVDQVQ